MHICRHLTVTLAAVALLSFLSSCGGDEEVHVDNGTANPQDNGLGHDVSGEGHAHTGPHGGLVNSIGDFHLELTFDDESGTITLYVLGRDESIPVAVDTRATAVHVRQEKQDDYGDAITAMTLDPIPQKKDPKNKSSRFVGTHVDLMGAQAFEVVVRIPIHGRVYRTTFQVDPGDWKSVFVCPLGCEDGKLYGHPGNCPVCNMELVEPQHAHADHSPKHGGQLFMALNQWHHVEGVVPNPHEFRIYMYDNFTKPISAERFVKGSTVEIVQVNKEQNEVDTPIRLPFGLAEDGSYLKVQIPDEVRLPLAIAARIKFEGRERPSLFNFTFEEVSKFREVPQLTTGAFERRG